MNSEPDRLNLWNLILELTSCVILHNLFVPQLTHLYNGDNINAS